MLDERVVRLCLPAQEALRERRAVVRERALLAQHREDFFQMLVRRGDRGETAKAVQRGVGKGDERLRMTQSACARVVSSANHHGIAMHGVRVERGGKCLDSRATAGLDHPGVRERACFEHDS